MSARKAWRRAAWRLTVAISLGVSGAYTLPANASPGFSPFEFALLGDPQIGYGQGGEWADASRFAKVVDALNASSVPLVVVPGDLVQDRSFWQQWLFDWQAGRIRAQKILAPGNHDVVDLDSLAAFRRRYGSDSLNVVFNDTAFVVIDSETARDTRISRAEYDAQWAFIESSLAAHRTAGRTHIVLVTHRPPFVDDELEPDSDANWPRETRARLLALARGSGVRWILAGHLHSTHTARTADGLQIVVVAGSARSFDRSPVDYRVFRVEKDSLTLRNVPVAPPTVEPFSVPGLRGWTPRLFDFSVRHWLFTVLYALAGVAALRTARAIPTSTTRTGWRSVAFMLFAFGINMQLDFDELIQEIGRVAAQLSGIYAIRHAVTPVLVLALGAVAAGFLTRHHRSTGGSAPLSVALVALAVPSAWFCLSAISHHDLGMLFNESWWDLLILATLAVIMLSASRARPARSTRGQVPPC